LSSLDKAWSSVQVLMTTAKLPRVRILPWTEPWAPSWGSLPTVSAK
jgi:hypothetical protein